MSELNKLKVVDFTAGRLSSDDINTNIPFRDNFDKTRTIQQANAVIGAYVNRNYKDMQNKADKDEIPTKLSELENDSGYITSDDIPTKTSDLTNDGTDGEHPFITADDIPSIPTKTSDLTNDGANGIDPFITAGDIPTDLSSYNNDVGYITSSDIPTDLSSYNNDVGYITNSVNDLTNYTNNTTLTSLLSGKASKTVGEYSTTETIVGTWYNNKPIYRKVIQFTTVAGGGQVATINDLDEIIDIRGNFTGQGNKFPPFWHINDSYYLKVNGYGNGIFYGCAGYVGYTANISVDYTKTTD